VNKRIAAYILTATVLSCAAAHAKNIQCDGSRGAQNGVVIIKLNDTNKVCVVQARALAQMPAHCDADGYCHFIGHVARQTGNRYYVDRIISTSLGVGD
jgi:hypothetical protein